MMNKVKITAVSSLILAATLAVTPAFAESEAEQTARTLCAGCHGPDGVSSNPIWPNLAGQKAAYTANQLKAYRDGTRSDPSMSGLAQPLTDAEIEALADYYSRLPAAK